MKIYKSSTNISTDCENIIRTLPTWFGLESLIKKWSTQTNELPTFVAEIEGKIIGFLSLKIHFTPSAEISLFAVDKTFRGKGIGGSLLNYLENWAKLKGVNYIQIKTLPDSHPSASFAESRMFYKNKGYVPLEVIEMIPSWSTDNSCLIYIKYL